MMTDAQRQIFYAPGGDGYNKIASKYGQSGADQVWQSFQTDGAPGVTNKLSELNYGQPLDGSTWDNFYNQIVTDPLAAPLEGTNTIIGNSVKSFFSNPWVVFAAVIIGGALLLYYWKSLKALVK